MLKLIQLFDALLRLWTCVADRNTVHRFVHQFVSPFNSIYPSKLLHIQHSNSPQRFSEPLVDLGNFTILEKARKRTFQTLKSNKTTPLSFHHRFLRYSENGKLKVESYKPNKVSGAANRSINFNCPRNSRKKARGTKQTMRRAVFKKLSSSTIYPDSAISWMRTLLTLSSRGAGDGGRRIGHARFYTAQQISSR